MPRDNYYETAATCFENALNSVDSAGSGALKSLARGLHLLAQGLLQDSRIVEQKLDDLARRLPPPVARW